MTPGAQILLAAALLAAGVWALLFGDRPSGLKTGTRLFHGPGSQHMGKLIGAWLLLSRLL